MKWSDHGQCSCGFPCFLPLNLLLDVCFSGWKRSVKIPGTQSIPLQIAYKEIVTNITNMIADDCSSTIILLQLLRISRTHVWNCVPDTSDFMLHTSTLSHGLEIWSPSLVDAWRQSRGSQGPWKRKAGNSTRTFSKPTFCVSQKGIVLETKEKDRKGTKTDF